MMKKMNNILLILAFIVFSSSHVFSETPTFHIKNEVPKSVISKIKSIFGISENETPYSVALITGVDYYPVLEGASENLGAAKKDLEILVNLFKDTYFDEIYVLWNSDFKKEKIESIIKKISINLKENSRSRFVYAHSGHGSNPANSSGILLAESAENFDDLLNSISLTELKKLLKPALTDSYQSLILINSCYSGNFTESFGKKFLPRAAGSHAIMAGGSDELTWGLSNVGSVFFSAVDRGIRGAADIVPKNVGDGVITTFELYTYLRQVIQADTNWIQNPKLGKLFLDKNDGELFFIPAKKKLETENDFKLFNLISFGSNNLYAFRGKSNSDRSSVSVKFETNLPSGRLERHVDGGEMNLSMIFNNQEQKIGYRDINFLSPDINLSFRDNVQVGFPVSEEKKIDLDINARIFIRSDRPSPKLSIHSGQGGEFNIDDYTTSQCNFSCYNVEIIGTWRIKVDNVEQSGRITSAWNGRGVGADARAKILASGFPNKLHLSDFKWRGNFNFNKLPPLVDITINDVPVLIKAPFITFNGHGYGQNNEKDDFLLKRL